MLRSNHLWNGLCRVWHEIARLLAQPPSSISYAQARLSAMGVPFDNERPRG